jgi:hypothetical protein
MKRAAMGGAVGLAVLAGFAQAPVRAEDGEEKSIWDWTLMEEIGKGLGLNRNDDMSASRERSPLVIPPSKNLPPPQAKASESVPAAWPVDPNAQKRKEAAKAKLYTQANKSNQGTLDTNWVNGSPISPSELNPPGTTGSIGGGGSGQPVDPRNNPNSENTLLPSQLGFLGNWSLFNTVNPKDQELGTFTSEPPRASLTQPPSGYQTPSPTAPYGLTNKKERYKTCERDIASGECK